MVAAGLLVAHGTRAQAPAWDLAARLGPPNNINTAHTIYHTAADAQGNLIVVGVFQGQFTLGSTTLTSAGATDLFIAKYLPATDTWAWAYRGGGRDFDAFSDVVVSGNTIYAVGNINNSLTNASLVTLGTAGSSGTSGVRVLGASRLASADFLLAKYTDNGTSATLNWTQVGGGTVSDYASRVAVSGTSVYVAGGYSNTPANVRQVVFGGDGTTAGTVPVNGASPGSGGYYDMLLTKYTDLGSTGVLRWVQVAGGDLSDQATGVAVQGNAVYLSGGIESSATAAGAITLGSNGTTAGTALQYGATTTISGDILLAKYTDNGTSATFNWSQVAGGTGPDGSEDLVASGTSVYVAGTLFNSSTDASAVVLGGSGATPGTRPQLGASAVPSNDLLLLKYQDNGSSGSFVWSQVAGGSGTDQVHDLALGNQGIYVVGDCFNNDTNAAGVTFGGSGTTAGNLRRGGATSTASNDVVVARYQDNGSSGAVAWAQVGGSPSNDTGNALALTGQGVYTISKSWLPATYGSLTVAGATGEGSLVIARLSPTVLPTRPGSVAPALALVPNPTGTGAATLSGIPPGAIVHVFDTVGRQAGTFTTDATGTAALAGLAPGLYLVRVGAATARLVVK